MNVTRLLSFVMIVTWANPPLAGAGQIALGTLHEEAAAADPRVRQLKLEAERTELRLQNISVERRPLVTAEALAQYQSDVPTPPPFLPGGQPLFIPPNQTYDATVRVEQPLYAPSISPRLAVERAQLAETQARIRTTLFMLRQEVNDAFFSAALLQERLDVVRTQMKALEVLLGDANARVRERTALPSESASNRSAAPSAPPGRGGARRRSPCVDRAAGAVDATVAGRRRDAGAPRSRTGGDAREAGSAGAARAPGVRAVRAHPRSARHAAQRRRRRGSAADLGLRARGLRQARLELHPGRIRRLLAGRAPRAVDTLELGQHRSRAAGARASAADRRGRRGGVHPEHRAGRSERPGRPGPPGRDAPTDDRIVSLRESVEAETKLRFDERVATVAEYLDRSNELLEARLVRVRHRVERAQARARFLTTLGLEVR